MYAHVVDFDQLNVHDLLLSSEAYFEGPQFQKTGLAGNESLLFGTVTHEIIGGGLSITTQPLSTTFLYLMEPIMLRLPIMERYLSTILI